MSTLTCKPNLQAHSESSGANMTSDGTNSYVWDAENRLIQITYPGSGNNSLFTIDATGMNCKIVENSGGSPTSTKQFIWCNKNRCEERDGGGSLTKKFFSRGQTNSGTNYFFFHDHLGSIREMTDSSGNIQAQFSYDPFGRLAKLQGSLIPDFQYAGYYSHNPSQLNLTLTRAYNSNLGRFINRDPIEESGGINLYAYVGNKTIGYTDPDGTWLQYCNPALWSNPAGVVVGLAMVAFGTWAMMSKPSAGSGSGSGSNAVPQESFDCTPPPDCHNPDVCKFFTYQLCKAWCIAHCGDKVSNLTACEAKCWNYFHGTGW